MNYYGFEQVLFWEFDFVQMLCSGVSLRLKSLILEGYYGEHKVTVNKSKAVWKINVFSIFQPFFLNSKDNFQRFCRSFTLTL